MGGGGSMKLTYLDCSALFHKAPHNTLEGQLVGRGLDDAAGARTPGMTRSASLSAWREGVTGKESQGSG